MTSIIINSPLPLEVADAKHPASPGLYIEESLVRGEGKLSSSGALVILTGKYTGRSPNDRYLVDTAEVHDQINWGEVNRPIGEKAYGEIFGIFRKYLKDKTVYLSDGIVAADPAYSLKVRVVTEKAYQGLFAHQMFRRPASPASEERQGFQPDVTVIACPSLKLNPVEFGLRSDAAILLHIPNRTVLIAGTSYCGEIKKSIFTILNYELPMKDVLPMHCAANRGRSSAKDVVLFFGLSGTGKTSLSADPERDLLGDDEHGWGPRGVFNFEGGYYAKCIRLDPGNEPEIWDAIRFGTLLENVVMDDRTRMIDFNDEGLTENTRATYPLTHIPRSILAGTVTHPHTIFFLTADAFGVLPPISQLSIPQAQYHFISGYTARLAGTERGTAGVAATFSTCFGAPFMPRSSSVYAGLLAQKMKRHKTQVYLVNTGWSGGPHGVGKRIPIPYTRAMIKAVITGALKKVPWVEDPIFRICSPRRCPGVPSRILNPSATWRSKVAYREQALNLARSFIENFEKFPEARDLARYGPHMEGF